jgi:hypothetical protein
MNGATRKRAMRRIVVPAALGVLGTAGALRAQSSAPPPSPTPSVRWLNVTGGLTTMAELYGRSGAGLSARPGQTGRIMANLTLSFANGLVVMPLSALISTDQVRFRQQINEFGISPTYHGVTVHLGHFAPQFSTFTLADQTLAGGGVESDQNGFRLGLVGGQARRAVAPGLVNGIPTGQPQFSRRLWAARVGFGRTDGPASIDFIYMAGEDNAGSLDSNVVIGTAIAPERNAVVGFKSGVAFDEQRVHLLVEGATSQNERQPGLPGAVTSSGKAGSAKLNYRAGTVTMGGTLEYVSPAFASMGNAGLTPDHVDYGLTFAGQLGQGRVSFNTMGGWRQNNLAHDAVQTTRRAIYTIAGTLQPVPAFGLDLQLANNVNNSRAAMDTAMLKNITGQYSVSPRFIWRNGNVQQVLVLLGNRQTSDNSTTGLYTLANTRTTTLVGTWVATFPSTLGLTFTATRTGVVVDTMAATVITTVAPGVQHSFAQQKLQLSVQLQLMRTSGASGSANEVYPLAQLRYAVAPGQEFQVQTSVRHNSMTNTGVPSQAFTEQVFTVQYTAAWR